MTIANAAFRAYLAELRAYAGRGLLITGVLMVLVGFLEGLGLMLLVPLLALVGFGDAVEHPLAMRVAESIAWLGLPFGLSSMLIVFVLLVGARQWLIRHRDLRAAGLQIGFAEHLRARLFAGVAAAEWRFLAASDNSEWVTALTGEAQRIGQGTAQLLRVVATAVVALGYLAVAITLSPGFTLLALVSGALLIGSMRGLRRRSFQLGARTSGGLRRLFTIANDMLTGMKSVKAQAAEDALSAHFTEQARRHGEVQLNVQRVRGDAALRYQAASAAVLAALVWGAVEILALPAPELLVLVVIMARLMPLFATLQEGGHQLLNMLPAYARFRRLERACAAAREPRDAGAPLALPREALHIENVSYAHAPDGAAPTLVDIDFTIEVGRTVALLGASGAGKSTLVDLIAGLLVPDRGRILLDGQALPREARHAWRARIAYLPQDTFLLPESIRANLRWARPDADPARIASALRAARADVFIARLPNGLDTAIGERGRLLSGGERQRLALAMALLREPVLLILDEATSALDAETERTVLDALRGGDPRRTVLLISHRPSVLRHADRVVLLERGRLVAEGPPAELARQQDARVRALLHADDADGLPSAPSVAATESVPERSGSPWPDPSSPST